MRPTDQQLMRLHDGELDPDERASVETALATDARARDVVAGLEQIGDVVRAVVERTDAPSDLVDDVMARIDAEQQGGRAPDREGLRVLEGGARGGATPTASPPGRGARIAAAGGAFAAAAAAAVVMALSGGATSTAVGSRPALPATAQPAVAPSAPVVGTSAEEDSSSAAIESIDFGGSNGSIFMVSAGDVTTPVVWVSDDLAAPTERAEPL